MSTKVLAFQKAPSLQAAPSPKDDGLVANIDKLVFWVRMIGIPLDAESIRPRWLRYLSTSFSLVSFFLNVGINAWALANLRKPESTNLWNSLISNVNFAFAMTLAHAGILLSVAPKWRSFALILERIESLKLFGQEDYRHFRKVCLYGGISFVIMTIVSTLGVIFLPQENFPVPFKSIFTIYMTANTIIFCCLGSIAASSLKVLSRQVRQHQNNHWNMAKISFVQFHRWQRCYHLIADLVVQMNNSFGFTLFVIFTFVFVWMVNGSYFLLIRIRDLGASYADLISTVFLIGPFFCFYFMVYIPHKIKQEALNFAAQLSTFSSHDAYLHQKAHNLMMRVIQLPLQITMMGMADIDLHLVPALIGTVLTYIIILLQFRTSENLPETRH